MADTAPKTIHFHIGPDRVFEELFRQVFAPFSDDVNLSFVSSEDYRKHFRDAVDGGLDQEIPQILNDVCSTAETIVLSRPRLLFDGAPMNVNGGGSFYKLDTIQKGFQGHKVIFHLFLTDHLGYLMRSAQPESLSASNKQFSWVPLVQTVSSKVLQGNELLVWNAEGKEFVQTFLSATTGLTGQKLDDLMAKILRTEKVPTPEAEEQFASQAALDVFDLDAAFENDIKTLQLA